MAQISFALFAFGRKDVTLVSFVAFDLTAAGDAEAFRGGSISFDFWHFLAPLFYLILAGPWLTWESTTSPCCVLPDAARYRLWQRLGPGRRRL